MRPRIIIWIIITAIALFILIRLYTLHWSSEALKAKANFKHIIKVEKGMDTTDVNKIMGRADTIDKHYSNKQIVIKYMYTTNTNNETFITISFDGIGRVSGIYIPKGKLIQPYFF